MKKILFFNAVFWFAQSAFPFEILALGTSNTNCKGANQAYTTALNEMLKQDGVDAIVINGGKDGDTPEFMIRRMLSLVTKDTRLVLFEPGPNERNKQLNLSGAEKILAELQKRQLTTIYISHSVIESDMEALTRAQKFDAIYYGRWNQAVPTDKEHRQYDQPHIPNSPGHMTEKGCRLWASNIYPLIRQTINDKGLR